MLGLQEVALLLLQVVLLLHHLVLVQAGAATHLREVEGLTAAEVARLWGNSALADCIER